MTMNMGAVLFGLTPCANASTPSPVHAAARSVFRMKSDAWLPAQSRRSRHLGCGGRPAQLVGRLGVNSLHKRIFQRNRRS
jgi:hypothetical protein